MQLEAIRVAGAALAAWQPAAKVQRGALSRAAPRHLSRPLRGARPLPSPPHHFEWHAGRRLCSVCLAAPQSNKEAARRARLETCPGVAQSLASAARANDSRGHVLALLVIDAVPCIMCLVCGARASRRINNLRFSCVKDAANQSAKARLRRVERELHPDFRSDRQCEWVSLLFQGRLLGREEVDGDGDAATAVGNAPRGESNGGGEASGDGVAATGAAR